MALVLVAPVIGADPVTAAPADHVLEPGEQLVRDETLRSPDGRSVLAMQADSNLVLYAGSRPVWQTRPAPGWAFAVMQADGNLVLYFTSGLASWQSGTAGNPGARAVLQDDGNFVVYSTSGVALWQSGTAGAPDAPPPFGGGLRLASDGRLGPGDQMQSTDERFVVAMQPDGNLVLYVPGGPRWQSGTSGRPGSFAVMQRDGNLVVYGPSGVPTWQSGTAGVSGAFAVLQDDGNLVVYGPGGPARWQSGTAGLTFPLTTVVAMEAGGRSSCAVLAKGSVRCWGRNDEGQLGDGTRTDSWVARRVSGLTDAVSVTVGDRHACAVLANGLVRCWGSNDRGQLGVPGVASAALPQAPVGGLADVRAVAAGTGHTCASLGNGTVRCWGAAGSNGGPADSTTPVTVPGLSGVVSISAGGSMSCARAVAGVVVLECWGQASVSLGGVGGGNSSPTPVEVAVGVGESVADVDVGPFHTCVVVDIALARCWGRNSSGQLGNSGFNDLAGPVALAGSGITRVAAGSRHSCGLAGSGTVRCWGANEQGEAGVGEITAPITTPRPVVLLDGRIPGQPSAIDITAGASHTCVATWDRRSRCWGDNVEGSLGDGSNWSSAVPVEVLSLG
jgi:alpha-tubulin suppressor-like RCC1 family protein